MKDYAFKRGYMQVKKKDLRNLRKEIMQALGVVTIQTFYNRMNGDVEPRVSEMKAIESIFRKYGITEIWGEE